MNTDNVLMHNPDMERDGGAEEEEEGWSGVRWILQTRLFWDSKWGKQQCGLLEYRRGEITSIGEEQKAVVGGVGGVEERCSLS